MFRVRSSFKGKIEVNAPLRAVRNFFANLKNFTEMLAGVEAIRHETGGIARWTIATETPVGHVRFSFPVRETSPHAELIEWSPVPNEHENLLRYSLKFKESDKTTVVDVTHQVELRRRRAWELHPGVGMMGEARLSSALQRRINDAIEDFLKRVKEKLEQELNMSRASPPDVR
jgi:carbon monoxide dehydrogenase subunit G